MRAEAAYIQWAPGENFSKQTKCTETAYPPQLCHLTFCLPQGRSCYLETSFFYLAYMKQVFEPSFRWETKLVTGLTLSLTCNSKLLLLPVSRSELDIISSKSGECQSLAFRNHYFTSEYKFIIYRWDLKKLLSLQRLTFQNTEIVIGKLIWKHESGRRGGKTVEIAFRDVGNVDHYTAMLL